MPQSLETAIKSTQVAVVLLSEEFFVKDWPQHELRSFLAGCTEYEHTIIPVFLGITHERCEP